MFELASINYVFFLDFQPDSKSNVIYVNRRQATSQQVTGDLYPITLILGLYLGIPTMYPNSKNRAVGAGNGHTDRQTNVTECMLVLHVVVCVHIGTTQNFNDFCEICVIAHHCEIYLPVVVRDCDTTGKQQDIQMFILVWCMYDTCSGLCVIVLGLWWLLQALLSVCFTFMHYMNIFYFKFLQ